MKLRQVINFNKQQYNTLYHFFFEGDGNLLPLENGAPFSKKFEQAREYWKGNVQNELPELLITGKIEVVEIIDECY